jgi:hypothetical protein
MTTGGVHMKPAGYRLWAAEMLKALGAKSGELRKTEARWDLQRKISENIIIPHRNEKRAKNDHAISKTYRA